MKSNRFGFVSKPPVSFGNRIRQPAPDQSPAAGRILKNTELSPSVFCKISYVASRRIRPWSAFASDSSRRITGASFMAASTMRVVKVWRRLWQLKCGSSTSGCSFFSNCASLQSRIIRYIALLGIRPLTHLFRSALRYCIGVIPYIFLNALENTSAS